MLTPEMRLQMLPMYRDTLHESIEVITAALAAKEPAPEVLRRHFHTFKSRSVLMGYEVISEQCRKVELALADVLARQQLPDVTLLADCLECVEALRKHEREI